MNFTGILDALSSAAFLTAIIIVIKYAGSRLDSTSRLFFLISLWLYLLVGVSNFLESGGVTKYFDMYEDYLQILFFPFFLFFNYSMMIKNEYDRRKKAETSQREKEKLYKTLIENINLGITLIDVHHEIIMINSPHADFFHKKPEEFIGLKCYREFEKRKHVCPDCPGVVSMRTGSVCVVEKYGMKDGGVKFPVRIRAFPVYENDNELSGFIEVVEDTSDFKHMEDELIKRKKLESVGLLAGGIAHDFNNLLTAIMGNISLAKISLSPENSVYGMLGDIENASLRARDLTHQLLTFSKGGAPIKKTTTISELITDSTNFILHGSQVVAKFNIQGGLWPVDADEGQISQVIYNLITNARQAMPGGGTVTVTAENLPALPEGISFLKDGKYVRIIIEDTGFGIPHENLQKIYDPFFTTKDDGSGLGLSTAYSIIKKHDGSIHVKSEPGIGTVFSIYLPVSENLYFRSPVVEQGIATGRGRIVLMDDEEIVRDVTSSMLRELGYEVIPVKNGSEAIAAYSESLDSGSPVDAVILDLTIPGEIGGLKTLEELKKLDPGIKAIVSSGYYNDPVMADYKEYGFCGMAPKPYKIRELGLVLRKIFNDPKK